MFETFRNIRGQLLLIALGCLALGAMMLIQPDFFLTIICYVVGALLIAYGVISILSCVKDRTIRVFTIMLSVIVIGIGIFIITKPQMIISILPIIFGVILVLDGILNVRHGIGLRRFGDPSNVTIIILGVITVILGAVILLHPYDTARLTFRLVGVGLAYNGLSDLLVLYRMNHAAKVYEQRNPGARKKKNKVIDVDVRPVDDEED